MTDLFGFQGLFNAQYSNSLQQQVYANQAMAQSQMQAMMNSAYANQMNPLAVQLAHNAAMFNEQQRRQRPTVSQTAASRVDKPDWEKRADQKEAELNDWLRSIGLGHIADMDFSDAGSE